MGTIIFASISVWVLGYLFNCKGSIWALWSPRVKTRRDVNIIYSSQHYIFLCVWMRKLRPMEMKGLPNIHSKIRADPRIGPGCLNCQCWAFNKLHSMCYPSVAHPTRRTKSKYLLLLSWNGNNRHPEEPRPWQLQTTEENSVKRYPDGKGLVRNCPCFPLHEIKMEAFGYAPIKKSSAGAWDGALGSILRPRKRKRENEEGWKQAGREDGKGKGGEWGVEGRRINL